MHLAAVTQIGHDSPGRAYHQRKIAERKSTKEAMRALKRKLSEAEPGGPSDALLNRP